jgi:hypothetical protein
MTVPKIRIRPAPSPTPEGIMAASLLHDCPGGCGLEVWKRLFACRICWFRLPSELRGPITRHCNRDTEAHAAAMADALNWYRLEDVA